MGRRGIALFVLATTTLSPASCRKSEGRPPEVLDLRVRLTILTPRPRAGWPVLVRYMWSAGQRHHAFDRPLRVFVHFLSSDGGTLINDDHALPDGLARIRQLETIAYERIVFPPEQFPGRLRVRAGLFDTHTGKRPGLGTPRAADSIATFTVSPASAFSRGIGWRGFYFPDGDLGNPFVVSRWMGQEGEVTFPAAAGDGLLALRAWTNRTAFGRDPTLRVTIGHQQTAHTIGSDAAFVLVAPVPKRDGPIGTRFRMDGTFVPALPDARHLGLCVTNVALVPRDYLDRSGDSNLSGPRIYP